MKKDDVEFELDDKGKSYVMIDDDMRLLMSPRNWQLQKRLIAQTDTPSQKKGDVNWTSFKYYITLQGALKDIIHIRTSKIFFNDAQGLVRANNKVITELCQAFSPEFEIKAVVNDNGE